MNQSFYTKEGLDYLYFARPGTAYGPVMGTITKSNFYDN